MAVDFKEVLKAFEFASSAPNGEARAYLHKITGKVYWQSDLLPDLEPLPEDIDSDDYLVLPDKRDLELGRQLVFDFMDEYLPDESEEIRSVFRRKGAYATFKYILDKNNLRETWHEFEAKAQAEALLTWCRDQGIILDNS
jgi:Uncharacterised protein family (UPF0158)